MVKNDMDIAPTTHLSLCSGYGGIDLGLRRAIPNLRTVAYAEIEAFAVENLLARMDGGSLDAAPIWPDIKTFPWESFRDRVDILSAGYPCQPFSAAGKRHGTEDPRHLWPYIADGVRILRPRVCFFENVEGHISLGLQEVIGELESMGYSVSWGIFSASEVGAPHQRKRVFILAMANNSDTGLQGLRECRGSQGWQAQAGHVRVGGNIWPSRPGEQQYGWKPPRVATDARRVCGERPAPDRVCGREICESSWGGKIWSQNSGRGAGDEGEGASMGDTEGGMPRQSSAGDWRQGVGGASEAGQLGNASSLGSHSENGNWEQPKVFGEKLEHMGDSEEQGCGRLDDEQGEVGGRETRGHADWSGSPEQQEQQEQGQTESSLGGDADGSPGGMDYAELCISGDNRTDELRLLGNGVVPATATLAFETLLEGLLIAEILR